MSEEKVVAAASAAKVPCFSSLSCFPPTEEVCLGCGGRERATDITDKEGRSHTC